jgi:hypothetical protein
MYSKELCRRRETMELADGYEYDVAISYSPEDYKHVAPLKTIFDTRGIKFADVNYGDPAIQAEIWGKNLYDYLTNLYQQKARYCIMFLSKNYASQLWTNLERQAAQARAFKERMEYILPVRLDDTEIPGILPTTFYIKCPPASPESIADALTLKLNNIGRRSSITDLLREILKKSR